jgi:hypothetical protein
MPTRLRPDRGLCWILSTALALLSALRGPRRSRGRGTSVPRGTRQIVALCHASISGILCSAVVPWVLAKWVLAKWASKVRNSNTVSKRVHAKTRQISLSRSWLHSVLRGYLAFAVSARLYAESASKMFCRRVSSWDAGSSFVYHSGSNHRCVV